MAFESRTRFKSGIFDHARFNISKKPGTIQNALIFGLPRQGKTVKLMDYAVKAHSYRRDKVWDIWDARRGENAMYPLPSKFLYWKNGRTDAWGRVFKARGFPTTLFFPMCQKLPNEIPTPSKVFTIPLTSLEFEDILALVGAEINPNIKPLWNALQKRYITKNTTMPELLKIIDDLPRLKVDSGKGYYYSPPSKQVCGTLKRALEMLDNEKIISSGQCPTCLNIKNEYKKKRYR